MASGTLTVPEAAILPPLTPTIWWDFGDIAQLFQATSLTTPVTGDGDDVASVANKGTATIVLETGTGNALAMKFDADVNGNGYPGTSFTRGVDQFNGEGLHSDSYDIAPTANWLMIWARSNVGTTGRVANMGNSDLGAVNENAGSNQILGANGKVNQADVSPVNLQTYAGWVTVTPTEVTCSLNTIAGTDVKTTAIPNPSAGLNYFGTSLDGTNNFGDGTLLECILWETTVASVAQMEAYATDVYGLAWA